MVHVQQASCELSYKRFNFNRLHLTVFLMNEFKTIMDNPCEMNELKRSQYT